jgi:hypothetical protein
MTVFKCGDIAVVNLEPEIGYEISEPFQHWS